MDGVYMSRSFQNFNIVFKQIFFLNNAFNASPVLFLCIFLR